MIQSRDAFWAFVLFVLVGLILVTYAVTKPAPCPDLIPVPMSIEVEPVFPLPARLPNRRPVR